MFKSFVIMNACFDIIFCLLIRGAGQEVGRSCIMLEFKGKKIMVSFSNNLLQLDFKFNISFTFSWIVEFIPA